nr:retrotransposable element Tf2 [Tanacetum cinerariifolium]
MSLNGLITIWDRFVESVNNRFGPSKHDDPRGALSKLLHLGTVEDYHREFEKLINRVTDIPDSLLISLYISGLKLHLNEEASPVVKGPLDASEYTLLSLRNVDLNFKIIEKRVECVRALNVALLEVVFAGPIVKVSSVIDDVFDISESNKESMEVHSKFKVGEEDDSGNAATDGDIQMLIDKGVDKEFQYYVYTLHNLIPFLKRLNDKHIESIASVLKGLRLSLSDEDITNISLKGLPSKYDNVYGIIVHRELFPDHKSVRSMLTTE